MAFKGIGVPMADETRDISPYRVLRNTPSMAEDLLVNGAVSLEDRRSHLRDLWRVLVKKRQVILGVLLASVIATTLLVFTMSPRYTATAPTLIERQAPNIAPVQQ